MIQDLHNTITVKLDSGATRHYFKNEHRHILSDLKHLQNGPVAQLPDNSYVIATYKGLLDLHPSLSPDAKRVLIYPQVTNESLLSVSQFTQDNCKVIFDDTTALIT